MGTKIYGITLAENEDSSGETIQLSGVIDKNTFIRDEHDTLDSWHILGVINHSKKIFKKEDCKSDKEMKCWNHVGGVPFLYAEGELFDSEEHPNAMAAASILRFCSQNDVALKPGFSVDGSILERKDHNGNVTENKNTGKILSKTLATSSAFTVNPCNPRCAGGIFLENDLQKSNTTYSGELYYEALKKSLSPTKSFSEYSQELALLYNLKKLQKSLDLLTKSHATIKCHHCSKAEQFYKAGKVPNACTKCGHSFSMKQIWNSLNQ